MRSLNVGRAIAWRWVEGVTTLTKENPSRPALADYVVPVTLSPADRLSQRSSDYFEYWSAGMSSFMPQLWFALQTKVGG